jgi:hypothetical protein
LDKEAAMAGAAARNPWVDRKSGRAKQGRLEIEKRGQRKVVQKTPAEIDEVGL